MQDHNPTGFPSPAQDYLENPLDLNDFVRGNLSSVFFVRYRTMDVLVVDKSLEPKSGHLVIASVYGDLVVMRLRFQSGRCLLYHEEKNPEKMNRNPIDITDEMECRIWGIVTHVVNTLVP